MAIIKGDFRYFAYYSSKQEMIDDRYLEERYLVSVIENGVCTDYEIIKTKKENSIKLSNGLYAVKVMSGNSWSEEIHEYYTTQNPVEFEVGGIKKGTEYQAASLVTILDNMFYGTDMIDFSVSDNLIREVHIHGENHLLTQVIVDVKRMRNKVVKQEVYVNGELIYSGNDEWGVGVNIIDVNKNIKDTTRIVVVLRDEDGNAVERSITEEFVKPIFYKIINSNSEPVGLDIKKMDNLRKLDDFEFIGDLMAQSVFIAIPRNKIVIESILDENNFNIKSIFDSYTTPVMLGDSTDETVYICYKSKELTIDNFKFTFKFKEV